jgi:hypothetical protein
MGEFADNTAALTFIQANKWDSSGDGAGTPQAGMLYFNTTYNQMYVYTGSAWASLGGGGGSAVLSKAIQFTQTVGGESNVFSSINLGLLEGTVYLVKAEMTSGTTESADVEFADGSFSGSPNVIYQIGYDGVTPLWNPNDGDWEDRVSWGFYGLSSTGILYWRLTNDGPSSMDFRITVKATGSETEVAP